MKWLLLDTEWSFAIFYGFPSRKPQFNPARNIRNRQFCINASWKWDHEVSVQNVSVLDNPNLCIDPTDFRNDRVCALAVHDEMNKADVIVCHNAAFDLGMLNVIFALHGLDPIPEKKIICTLKVARKYFRFAGNGLDDLLKFFGHEGKSESPDWQKMTEGDPEEIQKSIGYCDNDVRGLDTLLFILKPFMLRELPKPRSKESTEYYGIECCDACQSKRLRNKGLGGAANKPYIRINCLECGHPMKGDIKMWRAKHEPKASKSIA